VVEAFIALAAGTLVLALIAVLLEWHDRLMKKKGK